MIYIGYYIGDKLFYKIMEGDSFKLTEFCDNNDDLSIEFTTDKGEKFRDVLTKRTETSTRYVYNELHYFMILSDTDTTNNISIKTKGWVDSEDLKKTWDPLGKELSRLLQPTIAIMKKLGEQIDKMEQIKKDF